MIWYSNPLGRLQKFRQGMKRGIFLKIMQMLIFKSNSKYLRLRMFRQQMVQIAQMTAYHQEMQWNHVYLQIELHKYNSKI